MGGVNFSKLYTSFTKPTLLHLNMLQLFGMAVLFTILIAWKSSYVQLELLLVVLSLHLVDPFSQKHAGKSLQSKHYITKITSMFNICNGSVPDYLTGIIANEHETAFHYNTRNKEQCYITRCSTGVIQKIIGTWFRKTLELLNVETREFIPQKKY